MPRAHDSIAPNGEPAGQGAVNGLPYDLTKLDQAAKFYVRCGHPVVPVHPYAKNPYIKDWEQHPLRTVEEIQVIGARIRPTTSAYSWAMNT